MRFDFTHEYPCSLLIIFRVRTKLNLAKDKRQVDVLQSINSVQCSKSLVFLRKGGVARFSASEDCLFCAI